MAQMSPARDDSAMSPAENQVHVTIDVWADVICPWCYLGEERLAKAIAAHDYPEDFTIRVHAFQLDASTPTDVQDTNRYLAAKFGVSWAEAESMDQRVAALARAEGLPYVSARPVANTGTMLRLVALAESHGKGWQVLRNLQNLLFSGTNDIFDPGYLLDFAVQQGLPRRDVVELLRTDLWTEVIQDEREQAVRLGARGVPFVVLAQQFAIPGAVSQAEFAQGIQLAWRQLNESPQG